VSKAIDRAVPFKYEPQLAKYVSGKKLITPTLNAPIDDAIRHGINKQNKFAVDKKTANGITLSKKIVLESLNK
jgi:hypothetical protein